MFGHLSPAAGANFAGELQHKSRYSRLYSVWSAAPVKQVQVEAPSHLLGGGSVEDSHLETSCSDWLTQLCSGRSTAAAAAALTSGAAASYE